MKINIYLYIYQKQKDPWNKYLFFFVQGLYWPKKLVDRSKRSVKCETTGFYFKGQLSARQLFLILKVSKFI